MANAAKKELIHGIEASRLDEGAVEEALGFLDIHPADDTKLAGKVELLKLYFESLPEVELADCGECKATSSTKLARCPFCGVGEDAPADVPEPPAEDGDPPDAAEDGGNPGGDAAEDGEHDDGGNELPDAGIDPAVVLAPAEPAPVAPLVDAKKARAEKRAAKKANPLPAQDATGASVTAIVPAAKSKSVLRREAVMKGTPAAAYAQLVDGVAKLDAMVAEIIGLESKTHEAAYSLAEKVSALDESQLWKLRCDPKGLPVYRTFEDFSKVELFIGREFALTLKKAFLRFKREDFIQIGPNKLRLLMRFPEEQQAEVLQRIKENATGSSKRELEVEVRKKRKEANVKPSRPKTKAEKQQQGKITVASIFGKGTMALFRKPKDKDEKAQPAKQFSDGIYCWFDMGNDVRCWLYVKRKDNGEFVIQRDIKRVED